jgi:hypothetical protein
MGPLFVLVFWGILLTPVALLLGGGVSFLAPFLYYRLCGVPPDKRRRGFLFRGSIIFLFTVLFIPSICMLGFVLSFSNADDYWNYQGAFDFWRMPLEE